MKKILARASVVAIAAFVVALVALSLFLDRIIMTEVETAGPNIAKVKIRLASVSHSIFSGKGELNGFVISNPEGFKTDSAIKVAGISLAVQPSTVFSRKIIIQSINVAAPEITFEGNIKGNNLSKILANINSTLGTDADKNTGPSERTLQVNDLVITGGKINLAMPELMGKPATVPLP